MASIFKRFRGQVLLLMLASLSLRVLTGAAEVQVNFTSIIVEQHKSVGSDIDKESMLRVVVASNPTDASSIPDNLKTFATYKKYLTPESVIQLLDNPLQIPFEAVDMDGNLLNSYSQKVVYQPTSHSPPAVVPAHLLTRTTSAVESVNLENIYGEITINNSAGEFRSRQL
jgi:hypothetical protein